MSPAVEHKIDTLVAAPAAVEEALASLIVDNQDKYHALQYRALVTYVKRIYHPFLMCEPQVNQAGNMLTATWMFHDPRTEQTEARRQTIGAFLVVPSLKDLPRGLQLVGQAINNLAEPAQVDPSGSILHVAVCNGSDALAVSDGAAKLLASGTDLLGSQADDQFSSMELIGTEGPRGATATPKQIAQVVAAAINDATTLLSVMKVGTISVLAAAALMPVRNGFSWDPASKSFQIDPALRQVEPPVARLLELDKLPSNVSYSPSRNRQWHMYNCSERKDNRAPMLRRTFMRGLVRQMGSPAMLAATYSNNTEQVASAAVNELQEALTNCLEELTRPAPNHQGMAGRSDWVHIYHSVLPVLSLHQVDEGRVAGALRSACAALVAKNNTDVQGSRRGRVGDSLQGARWSLAPAHLLPHRS